MTTFYDFTANTIDGRPMSMEEFRGKTVVVTNTATRCPLVFQLRGLERLWRDYADRGVVVLGFPCNQFMNQEPDSNDQVESVCQDRYGITFPLFAKVHARGPDKAPLFRALTEQTAAPLRGELYGVWYESLPGRLGEFTAGMVAAALGITPNALGVRLHRARHALREALGATLESGFATFFSRSKQRLWRKGETSGHTQHVRSVELDCDAGRLHLDISDAELADRLLDLIALHDASNIAAVIVEPFSGSAGVFAIVLQPEFAALQAQALRRMRLFRLGASWGGVHSLVAVNDPRKGRTTLDWLPPGPVWRLSVGLEAIDDLIADLLGATERAHEGCQIGSYPFFREGRTGANFVVRSPDPAAVDACIADLTQGLEAAGHTVFPEGI